MILLVVHFCRGSKVLIDRIRVVECYRSFSFLNIFDVKHLDLLQLIITVVLHFSPSLELQCLLNLPTIKVIK